MPKVRKNLLLDEEAAVRGERYSRRHQTTLSRLVSDFLAGLPDGEPEADLTPAVRRLLGVAANHGTSAGQEDYHAHLYRKHSAGTRKRR